MLRMLNLGCGKRFHPGWGNVVYHFHVSGEVHQWMYDRHSPAGVLEEAEFVHSSSCRADESDIPGFNTYLLDSELNGTVCKPDSLFMETVKS